ncbi:MAG TPA: hypothetical protein VEQ40_10985, partial [Pyrinomonadaceae bacterium]|nr:hypothetical protein [Pyrinomonadaceae bacterium]
MGARLETAFEFKLLQRTAQESSSAALANSQVKDHLVEEQQQRLQSLEQQLAGQTGQLQAKETALAELQQQLQAKEQLTLEQAELLRTQEQQLSEQAGQLSEQAGQLSEQAGQLSEQAGQIQSQAVAAEAQQHQLQTAQELHLLQTEQLRAKDTLLEEQQQQLLAVTQTADAQEAQLQAQWKQLQLKEQKLQLKEQTIREQSLLLQEQNGQAQDKDRLISQLSEELSVLQQSVNHATQQLQATESLLRQSEQRLKERDAHVEELLTSRALRIGSTLTWPARKLRYSRFNFLRADNNGSGHPSSALELPQPKPTLEARPAVSDARTASSTSRSQLTGNFVLGIVTYNNSPEQLAQLSRSIEIAAEQIADTGVSLQVSMIDNGAECVWPETKIPSTRFASQGNIGFGRAMNVLMSAAFADPKTKGFLCVNPDGFMHCYSLLELLLSCHDHPRSLIEARQFPEEHAKYYDPSTLDTPWASGACLLIPRDIYTVIGGFDPNFFMYLEDID